MKRFLGLLLLLAGVGGGALVHTMRPPSGLGEALLNSIGGRYVIHEPYWQVLMGAAGIVALIGLILFTGGREKKPKE
jgi:hypothetical protein